MGISYQVEGGSRRWIIHNQFQFRIDVQVVVQVAPTHH